jgi:hypothetical protein
MATIMFTIAGSRGDFMLAIIGAGFCWALRTGRFPLKTAMIAMPMMLLLYGTMYMLRAGTFADERAGLSVIDRLSMTQISDVYDLGSSEAALRISARGAAPVMLEGYRATDGPLLGKTYAPIFTWFIPRALWPDKPRGAGAVYAQLFLGADKQGNSVPIGLVAEAYWNFWYPGVILIYGVYGALIFAGYHLFLRYQANPFAMAVFVRFLSDFRPTADSMVPFFHSLMAVALLWVVARLLAQERGGPEVLAPARVNS